jgi:hypothetical protein
MHDIHGAHTVVLSAVALAMPPVSYYHAVRGLSVWVDAVLSAEGRPVSLHTDPNA